LIEAATVGEIGAENNRRHAPLLLHAFPSFDAGGSQVRFATIANHFGARLRHLLVAMDGRYACRERLSPEVGLSVLTPAMRKGDTMGNVRSFRAVLRSTRPDALITYNWGSIEWAMANFPGLVRHLHVEDGFGPDEVGGQLRRRVWTRRLLLRRSTLVVPSRTLERIATQVWRLDPRRIRYIPNGIDCAAFAPASARTPASGPVIGTVAVLRREKNLGRLLRAFARLAPEIECRLVIVGDGGERRGLEALAAALGLGDKVVFAGYAADPSAYYAGFDIFALSSDTEQMPYSVIEAMASGLPVASTDVGDVGAMVAPENAPFLVPAADDALADALRRLALDPDLCRRIGAANRSRAVRDYDQARMFASYQALFFDA
jgi:glycosyltransferase involved in cell wall biosynthesis